MKNYPRINVVKTGKNIKRLVEEVGMTTKELSIDMGFANAGAIYRWYSGANLPSIDSLVILSAIFKVPIEDILVTEGGE